MFPLDTQRKVCEKYGECFYSCAPEDRAGVAVETLQFEPIYGVRKKNPDGSSSWYVWGGPHSSAPDFYQPLCASHLLELLPLAVPYLGLPPGYKFILDRSGYEDVWKDEEANQPPQATTGSSAPSRV